MESVVFEDSPLAQYLEGQGEAENGAPTNTTAMHASIPTSPRSRQEGFTFAPTQPVMSTIKHRKRPPSLLTIGVPMPKGAVAQIHETCSSAIHSRLGWTKNAHFLEQFRYIIIASRLLDEAFNPSAFVRHDLPQPTEHGTLSSGQDPQLVASPAGIAVTAAAAFGLAVALKLLLHNKAPALTLSIKASISAVTIIISIALYYYLRRQWLHYLRIRAVDAATSFTTSAQQFDSATAAGLTLIQEVELVSRGYQISSPMPPVSRLEDTRQVIRCTRLRRGLRSAIDSIFAPYFQAYENLKPYAVNLDLEKYFDIYEISPTDLQDAEIIATSQMGNGDDLDALQDLKISLQKLRLIRKVLLCTLLALDADGGKADFRRWALASDTMSTLSQSTSKMALTVGEILGEEEDFQVPPTPKVPLTPGRERMRGQMRKLGNLSQGIRGLQAKMRLLRDESDRVLDETDEASESRSNLLTQYDSIGSDLRDLMHEWEQGRTALTSSFAGGRHSRSVSTNGISHSRSPTLSLAGTTAIGDSPQDAFRGLKGHVKSSRSLSSTTNSSSGEEIFEAVAVPLQRSVLTRDERLVKMKEDRLKQSAVQDKARASTHMLKELETVIRLRPRGRTTGRIGSI